MNSRGRLDADELVAISDAEIRARAPAAKNARLMRISVFDTYIVREDGRPMRFDILVPDGSSFDFVMGEARKYLASRNIQAGTLSAASCRYCHSEFANEELERVLVRDGAVIFEIDNCD